MTEKPRIWWFWGSHILGFGSKNREKPWYLISVFWRFLTFGYTGDRTRYTGIWVKNTVFWSKIGFFSHILLSAKFNRFFIILGGGRSAGPDRYIRNKKNCDPQEIDNRPGRVGVDFFEFYVISSYIIYLLFVSTIAHKLISALYLLKVGRKP